MSFKVYHCHQIIGPRSILVIRSTGKGIVSPCLTFFRSQALKDCRYWIFLQGYFWMRSSCRGNTSWDFSEEPRSLIFTDPLLWVFMISALVWLFHGSESFPRNFLFRSERSQCRGLVAPWFWLFWGWWF